MQLLIPEIPSFSNFCHFRAGWEGVWALSVFLSQKIRGEDGTNEFRLLLLSPFFCFRKDSLNNSTETRIISQNTSVLSGDNRQDKQTHSKHSWRHLAASLPTAYFKKQTYTKTNQILAHQFLLKMDTQKMSVFWPTEILEVSSLPFFPCLFVCFPSECRLTDFTNFRIQYTFAVSKHWISDIYRKRQNLVYLLYLQILNRSFPE